MREIARELHVCFFGLQRPFSFLPDTTVWLTVGTVRAVKQTVVSLKLHAMSIKDPKAPEVQDGLLY